MIIIGDKIWNLNVKNVNTNGMQELKNQKNVQTAKADIGRDQENDWSDYRDDTIP